jgi:hypothetical protein
MTTSRLRTFPQSSPQARGNRELAEMVHLVEQLGWKARLFAPMGDTRARLTTELTGVWNNLLTPHWEPACRPRRPMSPTLLAEVVAAAFKTSPQAGALLFMAEASGRTPEDLRRIAARYPRITPEQRVRLAQLEQQLVPLEAVLRQRLSGSVPSPDHP